MIRTFAGRFKALAQAAMANSFLLLSMLSLSSCHAVHLAKGAQFEADGQYQKAIEEWNQVISSNPKSGISYLHRAYDYAKLGNYQSTIDDTTKTIEFTHKNGTKIRAYMARANAFLHLDQYQKAVSDANQVIELDPKIGTAYFYRAQAHQKLGDKIQSKEDMLKAKQLGYNTEPQITDFK